MLAGLILIGLLETQDGLSAQNSVESIQKREFINNALKPYRFQPLSHQELPKYAWPVNIDDVAVAVWLNNPLEGAEKAYGARLLAHFRMPGKQFDPVVVDAVFSKISPFRAWVDIVGDLWVRDDVRIPTTSDDDVVTKIGGFAANAMHFAKRAAFYEPVDPVSLPYKQSVKEPEATAYLDQPLLSLSGENVYTLVRSWGLGPSSFGGSGPFRWKFVWAYDYKGTGIFLYQAGKDRDAEDAPLIEGFELMSRLAIKTDSVSELTSQLEKEYEGWNFVSNQYTDGISYINATREPFMFEPGMKIRDLRTFLIESGKTVKKMQKPGSMP